ncbi:nuclease EXOG, mitochondrial-like [Hemiscyllium ocellatum]|uniref:nuclease EXOG, mitochondrial-like n=1 Tax=Hemiscyllium ocellatum TaxID=170820 RepID=UPI0029670F42|nr:nuclease EXOG, mitochondrial-like [Hemiscyllium ocellatum]
MAARGGRWLLRGLKRGGGGFGHRFVSGFLSGSLLGSAGCALALHWYRERQQEEDQREHTKGSLLGKYGLPVIGTDVHYCTNHVSSYDQAKRTPRWVLEHITKEKLQGEADRKHCKFKPDPNIPLLFSAMNEDYLRSGWSRGHMAPAGDNKFSTQAMAETFYLSNIVPQNYENNAGFWNRLEMYCRELTQRYENVWVISGPLTLPVTGTDGKKSVSYQVIGKNEVAVPTHLYKIILIQKGKGPSELLALGAFVVPNSPIGFDHQLSEYQLDLQDLERMSGITFFPALDKAKRYHNLCQVDTCKLLNFAEFTQYIAGRKVKNAKTLKALEKIMGELRESGIEPDEYLQNLYLRKKQEVERKETAESGAAKAG